MKVLLVKLTSVRWPDDGDQPLFSVVGEQHREEPVAKSLATQTASPRSRPYTAILVQETDNPHDSLAVAVHFRDGDSRHHVGFLPRSEARLFRQQMSVAEWGDVDLEVLACVTDIQNAGHPQVYIYLPTNFGELCSNGYHLDGKNHPYWLATTAPVPVKTDGSYNDEELCRIYCRYAQSRGWRSLPNMVETAVLAWRNHGLGPMGLALKAHEDGAERALAQPEGERALAHRVGRHDSPTPRHHEISVTYQQNVSLDGVLAWGPHDEWLPTRRIDVAFCQAVTAPELGHTLVAESVFEFRCTTEKGKLTAPIRVPCHQVRDAFNKLCDITLAMQHKRHEQSVCTTLVEVTLSKDCSCGCGVKPNGSLAGFFRLRRQRLELDGFWLAELIYLLAKAFSYMRIETKYTPQKWLECSRHKPHLHGGQIPI